MADDTAPETTTQAAPEQAPSAPAETPDQAPTEEPKTISYDRFREVITERNLYRSKYQEAQAAEEHVSHLTEQVETLKAAFEAQTVKHEQDSALLTAGITDHEGQDTARWLYSRVQAPEGEDKMAFGEWLSEVTGNPEQAPKALHPFLSTAPTKTQAPDPHKGVTPGGDTRATDEVITPARIRELAAEANRTGDWSKYNKLRPQILASIGKS